MLDLAHIFVAWLLFDLLHILANFPKLGAGDTVVSLGGIQKERQ